ncbi:hypothetical protein BpHYR1_023950 [Brachionus plicatilis]|uniref:Uncharacterized protein n=1 Tax=Brachionus plicatilis TaxID=10195 RepID=A0A3M7SQ74_BRAPC|nr:hypothetical protein BpHYR1_023950 [Brachionus plicatilis]
MEIMLKKKSEDNLQAFNLFSFINLQILKKDYLKYEFLSSFEAKKMRILLVLNFSLTFYFNSCNLNLSSYEKFEQKCVSQEKANLSMF